VVDGVEHGNFAREDGGTAGAGAAEGAHTVPLSCRRGGCKSMGVATASWC